MRRGKQREKTSGKKGLRGMNSMEGRMKDTQRREKGRTQDGKAVITMREGQRGEVEIKGTIKKRESVKVTRQKLKWTISMED